MLHSSPQEQQIENLVSPICQEYGVELVGVRYLEGKGQGVLQVIIDKIADTLSLGNTSMDPVGSGVTIDDCTHVSRSLSTLLDAKEDLMGSSSFQLEVTSPGLDRPLFKISDFERFKGFKVRIKTSEKIEDSRNFQGEIDRIINETSVVIMVNQKSIEIPFSLISKANLVY